ncbi:zinc-binding dehydrogenase [Amylibacter sp. IMCC11727]|uniref:alcohol dehydrogenase catalytic domain-containing protein n=1 Tax=Amylibacter sp. IMCC11727 TaxID=3039851 RepID=UPI00244DCF7A|nr:zinc-binding dehydrogenase [Amylibacter sp. IMCC11727]WGI22178.1 zinc-binding dehydrogenase [Amylibacter sp. IMCC11727]
MSDLPNETFSVIQKLDGYSGRSEGPVIEDAAEYLKDGMLPMPTPGKGQVLIKLRMASVNPSDLHFIKGEYGQPREQGKAAGFEGCGDVVAAGEGAEHLVGQRVAFVTTGAWSEYCVTMAMMCIPLHPSVKDEDGAAQIVNPLTAVGMVDIAEKNGDCFVMSAAASQLGKLMLGLAKDKGLKTICLVRRKDAADALMALGATVALDVTADDFDAQFAAASREHKPRVFLDAVTDAISERVFTMMPNRARWVSYGKLNPELFPMTQMGQLIFQSKVIEGFWLTPWMQANGAEMPRFAKEVQTRFADGTWKTDVATYLPLRDVVSGLAAATQIKDGKIMITP